jgi:hypothetical protein
LSPYLLLLLLPYCFSHLLYILLSFFAQRMAAHRMTKFQSKVAREDQDDDVEKVVPTDTTSAPPNLLQHAAKKLQPPTTTGT